MFFTNFSPTSGSGDVTGPGSSTDNALARFDGLSGKIIQNSLATLDDNGIFALSSASTATSGTVTGDTRTFTVTPSGATTNLTARGLVYSVTTASANNFLNLFGQIGTAQHNGSGTVTTALGAGFTVANSSNGTITDGYSIRVLHNNTGGGTFTNYAGIYFVESGTAATNRYSFKFDSGFVTSNKSAIKILASGGVRYFPITASENSVTITSDASYAVLSTDYIVNTTRPSTGTATITLPLMFDIIKGQMFIVKDASGNAAANNITISNADGVNIDGAASTTITTNYGVKRFYSDGSQWWSA